MRVSQNNAIYGYPIEFSIEDIVRSGLCKEYLLAKDES